MFCGADLLGIRHLRLFVISMLLIPFLRIGEKQVFRATEGLRYGRAQG